MKSQLSIGVGISAVAIALGVIMVTRSAKSISIWDRDPSEVRALINSKIMEVAAETPEVTAVHDVSIPFAESTFPLRIYIPNNTQNNPVILMIHGGAWVAGSIDTHDHMARYLCTGSQAIVVSVGYTNSPEAKYPVPLEQCYAALVWIVKHAAHYKGDTTRLAVVGDSSGGNMATALCLMARDKEGPKIIFQVLINPAPDLTVNGILERQNDALDFMRWQVLQYVTDPKDVYEPTASPILADVTGLPPALILLAEKDAQREDGQKYADHLTAAAVPTTVYIQPGVDHLAGNGARASALAQESLNVATAALKATLHSLT